VTRGESRTVTVVKGIKVVKFVRFFIIKEFKKVDIKNQGVNVNKDEFRVINNI
jgi:hypothetical protein